MALSATTIAAGREVSPGIDAAGNYKKTLACTDGDCPWPKTGLCWIQQHSKLVFVAKVSSCGGFVKTSARCQQMVKNETVTKTTAPPKMRDWDIAQKIRQQNNALAKYFTSGAFFARAKRLPLQGNLGQCPTVKGAYCVSLTVAYLHCTFRSIRASLCIWSHGRKPGGIKQCGCLVL